MIEIFFFMPLTYNEVCRMPTFFLVVAFIKNLHKRSSN